jgi:hypothetical protein
MPPDMATRIRAPAAQRTLRFRAEVGYSLTIPAAAYPYCSDRSKLLSNRFPPILFLTASRSLFFPISDYVSGMTLIPRRRGPTPALSRNLLLRESVR